MYVNDTHDSTQTYGIPFVRASTSTLSPCQHTRNLWRYFVLFDTRTHCDGLHDTHRSGVILTRITPSLVRKHCRQYICTGSSFVDMCVSTTHTRTTIFTRFVLNPRHPARWRVNK